MPHPRLSFIVFILSSLLTAPLWAGTVTFLCDPDDPEGDTISCTGSNCWGRDGEWQFGFLYPGSCACSGGGESASCPSLAGLASLDSDEVAPTRTVPAAASTSSDDAIAKAAFNTGEDLPVPGTVAFFGSAEATCADGTTVECTGSVCGFKDADSKGDGYCVCDGEKTKCADKPSLAGVGFVASTHTSAEACIRTVK